MVTLTAYPADGHRFVHWSTGDADRSISFTLVSDTLIEAIFERIVGPQPDTTRYTVTVNVNDTTMGYVTGGGVYDSGAVVSLSAVANPGYRFVQWSNGLTSSSIQFHAVADITLTAVFATEEGIGGVEGLDLTVSVQHRTVTVSGANGHALEVFDLSGRRMAHRAAAADAERIALPHSGVYLLKVEGMPARRIIVF